MTQFNGDTRFVVSAIVSTYNAERVIRGCLEDLEAQTMADRTEIIVVDSCSPQNERAIVEEFQSRYDNIRYIRTPQRETIYAAWNRAAEIANGVFLTNANTDDRHRPDAFECMVRTFEHSPACAVAYGDCAVTRTENQSLHAADITGYFKWPEMNVSTLFMTCCIGPQPMWRRSLHERHGWFDARMRSAGDYEYWLRLAVAGARFVHVPEVLGLYLASPSGVEHSDPQTCREESERARERYWRRRWGKRPHSARTYFIPILGKEPLVTVVIPTRNREEMLADALRSLVAQDYDCWEAIVVNDGGRAIGAEALSIDPAGRIRYLDQRPPFGQAAARNTALRVARGDIICYLDDDDLFYAHHLSTIVSAMQQTPAPFVYTDSENVSEIIANGTRQVQKRYRSDHQNLDFDAKRLHVSNYLPINTWGHRRDCLSRIGLFDETLESHEDWEFVLRAAQHFDIRRVPTLTAEVRVRHGAVDSVTSRQRRKWVDIYWLIYRRYMHLSADPVVRRARRERLAVLAGQELSSFRTGVRRTFFLWALRALGGALPVQQWLNRHIWYRLAVQSSRRSGV